MKRPLILAALLLSACAEQPTTATIAPLIPGLTQASVIECDQTDYRFVELTGGGAYLEDCLHVFAGQGMRLVFTSLTQAQDFGLSGYVLYEDGSLTLADGRHGGCLLPEWGCGIAYLQGP